MHPTFGQPFEVVDNILQHCPYATLIALSRVNCSLRPLIFRVIRSRLFYFAGLFMPIVMVPHFFELLERSKSSLAGSIVRCIVSSEMYPRYRVASPSQLNIIVPNSAPTAPAESQFFQCWERFLNSCGYTKNPESAKLPSEWNASCNNWSLFILVSRAVLTSRISRLSKTYKKEEGSPKISVVEAKKASVFPVVFQTTQTSNFFVMSPTRIYSLYPGLQERSLNLSLKHRALIESDIFDCFNYGLVTLRGTDEWSIFDGKCGEACSSIRRRVKNFPGWTVFRWGGYEGKYDLGDVVSEEDGYDEDDLTWKLDGECSNQRCSNFLRVTDLYDETFWYWN